MSFSDGNAVNNAGGCEAKSTWRWRHSTGHKSSSISSSSSSSNGRGEGDVRCRPTTATSGATQRRHFTANNDNNDDDDEWLLLHVTDRTVYSASYMTERRPLMLVLRLGRAGFRCWQLRWRTLSVAAHVVCCAAPCTLRMHQPSTGGTALLVSMLTLQSQSINPSTSRSDVNIQSRRRRHRIYAHISPHAYIALGQSYRARQLYKNISMLFLFPVKDGTLSTGVNTTFNASCHG